ncbi:SDR family NAD(P)-dependent oxidoreductase [Achromobacter xylosoxidans]
MDGAQEAVLVTGGASGIGLAVARGLLGAGRRVLVADVSQERLDEVRGWRRRIGWAACGWMCPTRRR